MWIPADYVTLFRLWFGSKATSIDQTAAENTLYDCILNQSHFLFQLFMIDNCADDWRIAMTWQRITQIGMELVICAVHPIPGEYYFLWTTKLSNHGGKIGSQWVPVDVTLSLPMFLRLYLICRYDNISNYSSRLSENNGKQTRMHEKFIV